jgi:large subunit ribosomal protein L9
MRVLLRGDVDGVGRRGDIVNVADGFARNFLFPTGQALKATEGIEGQATSMRRARDLRLAQDEKSARIQAEALTGATVIISARAAPNGRLFGSVAAGDIAEALEAQKGIQVDRESIVLGEAIKSVGVAEVPIRLFGDLSVSISVEVTAAD